jgi:hypothetical protein
MRRYRAVLSNLDIQFSEFYAILNRSMVAR